MKKKITINDELIDDNNKIYFGDPNHYSESNIVLKNKDLLLPNRFDFGGEAQQRFYPTSPIKKNKLFSFKISDNDEE